MRVSAVTVKTRKGETIKAVSNEDEEEVATEKILLEPWVTNTEGFDKEKTIEGMKQEISRQTPNIGVFVDSDWAGCPTTRKSTTGFVIKFTGSTIHFGSRTQATIALSSAEAELYAINTGATEALHIRNLLQEALNIKKMNIRIHTDSSSSKSMATRIGSSKKANHIELKHFFIQQLVQHDLVRIIKINTANNTADIFTKYVSTNAFASPQRCWAHHPAQLATAQQQQFHLRSNACKCNVCLRATCEQRAQHAHTHKHTLDRAMVLTDNGQQQRL